YHRVPHPFPTRRSSDLRRPPLPWRNEGTGMANNENRGSKLMRGVNATKAALAALLLLAGLGAGAAHAQMAVENIGFAALPGDRFQIALEFDGAPPQPEVFLIENPARLSMDFPGVTNNLNQRQYDLDFGSA